MAKVTVARLVLDGSEKNELDFKYDINVNTEGVFSTTLPKEIVELFATSGMTNNNAIRNSFFDKLL